jgi:hypothetical protein
MVLGSGIRDPGSGKNLFRIPDPGVKKHLIPDPGSATLQFTTSTKQCHVQQKKQIIQNKKVIYIRQVVNKLWSWVGS